MRMTGAEILIETLISRCRHDIRLSGRAVLHIYDALCDGRQDPPFVRHAGQGACHAADSY